MNKLLEMKAHAATLRDKSLVSLSEASPHAELKVCGWYFNLARHFVDDIARTLLSGYAQEREVPEAIDALFSGKHVNPSEDRPALHWALRSQPGEGDKKVAKVRDSLKEPMEFADKVRMGLNDGPRFRWVVHIGIGGSDLGPRLVHDAFPEMRSIETRIRFCSNVDPLDIERTLLGLNPAETLVIGVSKSFGTEETLYNLNQARRWLQAEVGDDWTQHVALITGNEKRAVDWLGEHNGQIFDMPKSVGGRYSVWSAASLSCMIAYGSEWFKRFLAGAHDMDMHVREVPLQENIAVRLAMLDFWNASVLGYVMRVVLGYSNRLRILPSFLQQLELESNGKSVGPDGEEIALMTAPALWGGEGSVGQHSYHQWMHQGQIYAPTEFIVGLNAQMDGDGTNALLAHALAQAEVLAGGRSYEDIQSADPDAAEHLIAQKVLTGRKPSTFMLCEALSAKTLGALLALYEHRTYIAGVLWGVNSFDQWGVEFGKISAKALKNNLEARKPGGDGITQRIMQAHYDG